MRDRLCRPTARLLSEWGRSASTSNRSAVSALSQSLRNPLPIHAICDVAKSCRMSCTWRTFAAWPPPRPERRYSPPCCRPGQSRTRCHIRCSSLVPCDTACRWDAPWRIASTLSSCNRSFGTCEGIRAGTAPAADRTCRRSVVTESGGLETLLAITQPPRRLLGLGREPAHPGRPAGRACSVARAERRPRSACSPGRGRGRTRHARWASWRGGGETRR
jgi:hypothetical protein